MIKTKLRDILLTSQEKEFSRMTQQQRLTAIRVARAIPMAKKKEYDMYLSYRKNNPFQITIGKEL
jgi:hypothetical protein